MQKRFFDINFKKLPDVSENTEVTVKFFRKNIGSWRALVVASFESVKVFKNETQKLSEFIISTYNLIYKNVFYSNILGTTRKMSTVFGKLCEKTSKISVFYRYKTEKKVRKNLSIMDCVSISWTLRSLLLFTPRLIFRKKFERENSHGP